MQSCQSGRQNDVQNLAEEMEDEAAWFVTSLRALGLLWVTIKANNCLANCTACHSQPVQGVISWSNTELGSKRTTSTMGKLLAVIRSIV